MQTPWHHQNCREHWGCHPDCPVRTLMQDRRDLLNIIAMFKKLPVKSAAFAMVCEEFSRWEKRNG